MQTRARQRPVGAIEIASSVAASVAPRALRPGIDRLRHDVRAIVDGLAGKREPSFMDPSTPRVVPVPLDAIDPIEHMLPRGALRARWSALRTDVSWVLRDLRGERRPVLIPRPARPPRLRSASVSARPLRVVEVVRETADAVSVVLEEASGGPIAFEAGQFLTFHLSDGGELLRRAYSLSTSPLQGGRAAVTVKRMGRGSALMHALRAGDTVSALGPSGTFVAPADRAPAHLVMIAGGSGITPVISILETALLDRPELRVTLIYGSRAWPDVIFRERLEDLSARFPERLRVDHVLHEPDEGWTGPRGLLDRDVLERQLPPESGESLYYVCGPVPMMDAAREVLAMRGVGPERIREERFHSPTDTRAPLLDGPVMAHVLVGGRDHVVRVDPGQTLLEAGLAAGADLPFSCAMGGCGACKVKLVRGTVSTDESSCLSPRERAEGFILACCSRPTSPVALEVAKERSGVTA